MSKRSKHSEYIKLKILMEYENGYSSINDLCKVYEFSRSTFYEWKKRYAKYGFEGLKESRTWKHYPKELKKSAVLDYLSGNYSQNDVVDKYDLTDHSILRKWIKRYNSHKELNTTGGRKGEIMTKGRKTNLTERIEIVKYCLNQNKDYQKASEVYGVSYSQVYQWVKKYEEFGEAGLVDRRGKAKMELSQKDKEIIEIRKLKKDNERLRMENDFLKKLQELERGEY